MLPTPLLTVAEVGDFLRLKQETVYLLIAKEDLPAFKVGGQWRFDVEEIRAWFKHKHTAPAAKTN